MFFLIKKFPKRNNMNGGGIYAVILNCNGGEQFDKISRVDVYDIFDLIDQVIRMV